MKDRLKFFPQEGWCHTNDKDLLDFLKKRCPNSIERYIKQHGVAWNAHSFWSVNVGSSKPFFELSQLEHFILKKGVPIKEIQEDVLVYTYVGHRTKRNKKNIILRQTSSVPIFNKRRYTKREKMFLRQV